MGNKINFEIHKESWTYFFTEIKSELKYSQEKVFIKLSEYKEIYIWGVLVDLWVILKIKKVKYSFVIEIIFWIQIFY